MDEQTQANFAGWALLEIFGHQQIAGYVTTEAYGQAVMFRVDVPGLPARERIAEKSGYSMAAGRFLSEGDLVREEPAQGYTKLYGAGAIYALTPCTEEAAWLAIDRIQPRTFMVVEAPRALAAGAQPSTARSDEQDDGDRDDLGGF